MWRRILEAWGGTVGMNFDPSHLVWQMLDADRFIKEFGRAHLPLPGARTCMIDRDGFYEAGGAMSNGMGWQIRRLPGLGDGGLGAGVLARCTGRASTGDCIIEHEDRGFEGTDELVKRGFLIARDTLRPYCE